MLNLEVHDFPTQAVLPSRSAMHHSATALHAAESSGPDAEGSVFPLRRRSDALAGRAMR
jgi:hypothetical protein